MKKPKTVKPFYFKDLSHEDMMELLNNEFPVNIKYNEDLVNRVAARYPLLDKSKIGIIVKAVFSSFRDFLVLGKVLNFNSLFFDTKLLFFKHREKNDIYPALKVEITTPPKLRKNER